MSLIAREVIAFAKTHPVLFTTNTLLSLTFPIDDILIPFLLGSIISKIEKKSDWMKPLIILISIMLTMQVVYTLTYLHDAHLIPKLENFIKHRMIESFANAYEGRPLDVNTGELMSRFTKIPLTITSFYESIKNWMIPYTLSFAITATILMRYDLKIGSIVMISAIIIFTFIFTSHASCGKFSTQQEQTQSDIDEEVDDIIHNLPNIYTANSMQTELNRLSMFESKYNHAYQDTIKCIMKKRGICTIVLAAMVISVIVLINKGLKNKTLTTGVIITILTIIIQWFGTLGWMVGSMRSTVINWGIISSFKLPSPASSKLQAPEYVNNNDKLLITDLTYSVGSKTIINHLNMTVNYKERVAIVGEIGSGKSTLLKLIAGLYTPTSGNIYLNGIDISTIPKRVLTQKIAYVPQNPNLFNRTIIENIKYGSDVDDITVIKLINELGIADAFPQSTDTKVGKGGTNLSGGQRQIVVALRAMFQNPEVLILDEVTSSLDPQTKQKLFKVLDRLCQDKTVILVTHDKDLLKFATRVVHMHEGRLVQ